MRFYRKRKNIRKEPDGIWASVRSIIVWTEEKRGRMIKKDVLEVRRQFTAENCAITRICGCYVDHEKNKKTELRKAFLSLPEEEAFKYFDIFRQTLSGTLGKNLLNMEFPLEQEMPGGTQEFLLKLRDSRLEDEMLVEEFYDKVIAHYLYEENYYIVLIHGAYDIPGKAKDGSEMFDASDEVYEYLMCSICPVKLSKAGLSYNAESNCIEDRTRDWVVEPTAGGFLFPAFNERSTDLHSVLYYSKKPEELQSEFIEQVLGSRIPMTAKTQKGSFQAVVMDTLGEDCGYDIVRNIHENLTELLEESKEASEPVELGRREVKRLLEESGVPTERMESFERGYADHVGEKNSLLISNIANARNFSIETPDVIVKVNPERADLVETREIDGRQCLVIAINDQVEVNGIPIRAPRNTCP